MLQRWFENKPASWSVAIAARAALRMLPLIELWQVSEETANAQVLSVFRAAAIARFAATTGADTTKSASLAASAAAVVASGSVRGISDAASASASAASAAAAAPSSATSAASAASAIYAAVYNNDDAAIYAAAVTKDLQVLEAQVPPEQVARRPLWPGAMNFPDARIGGRWERLSAELIALNRRWEVWIQWYLEVLAGSPGGLLRGEAWNAAFTDFDAPLPWNDGAEAVNEKIAKRLKKLNTRVDESDESSDTSQPDIPAQSPAPVRVEERDGKVAKVSDRNSALFSAERDFDDWRKPVASHIDELTSGDFKQGTNHSQVRTRLVALGKLLHGGIPDVKERQFDIGYEIDRFERVIQAYRSGGDDVPALNALTLEDLDGLRVALKMGVSKLERWIEFQQASASDPADEGTANPERAAEGLEQMAEGMERQPKYFSPELPISLRALAEAIKDPFGASKVMIYGAVKSAENVISFLGQRALGIGVKAADAVEQHISKGVATFLVTSLAGAALQISGALPHGWAWLKPLLDLLAKAAGAG